MHDSNCGCMMCSLMREVERAMTQAEQYQAQQPQARGMTRQQWRDKAAEHGYVLLEVETGIAALSPEDVAWLKEMHITL